MVKIDKPLVSVVVPVYNVEKYIDHCIESIVNQSYKNIEIILVDDGSTDSSTKICDKWTSSDKRIKVIHKKNNEGLFLARMTGFALMNGVYFTTVDGDDYIAEDFIENLLESIEEKSSDIVISNKLTTFSSSDNNHILLLPRIFPEKDVFKGFLNNLQKETWGWSVVGKLYKYSIYSKSHNFLQTIHSKINTAEDLLFLTVFSYSAKKVNYIDNYSGYYYRYNTNSTTRNTSDDSLIKRLDSLVLVLNEISNFFRVIGLYNKYQTKLSIFNQHILKDYYYTAIGKYISELKEKDQNYNLLTQNYKTLYKQINDITNSKSYKIATKSSRLYNRIKRVLK